MTTVLAAILIAAVGVATFTDVRAEGNRETESLLQKEAEGRASESDSSAGTEQPVVQAMNTLKTESTALTMEKLIAAYQNGELSRWTVRHILQYGNMSRHQEEGKDFGTFKGNLSYEGIEYKVDMNYSEERLTAVSLENMETGEDRDVYVRSDIDGFEQLTTPLETFLHHDKVLDEEISYTLPEKLMQTKDSYNVGYVGGGGRLFYREEKEKYALSLGNFHGLWNTEGSLVREYLCYD